MDADDRRLVMGLVGATLLVLWTCLLLGVSIGLGVRVFHLVVGG